MTNFKARQTVYKGITMRSRLEAGFAMWLDKVGFEWEYEPECFADGRGQYLPDFRIDRVEVTWDQGHAPAYIEVKPANFADDWALADRMSVIYASHPEAVLLVARPHSLPSERLTIVARVESDNPAHPGGIPWRAAWLRGKPPVLGIPLQEPEHPWAGEYWDVKR